MNKNIIIAKCNPLETNVENLIKKVDFLLNASLGDQRFNLKFALFYTNYWPNFDAVKLFLNYFCCRYKGYKMTWSKAPNKKDFKYFLSEAKEISGKYLYTLLLVHSDNILEIATSLGWVNKDGFNDLEVENGEAVLFDFNENTFEIAKNTCEVL